MVRLLGHLAVLLWVLMCAQADDCVYKECTCDDSFITCEDRGLTNLNMSYVGGSYSTLNLETNSLTVIPAGSLPPNLTGIHLESNPITTIADTAFDDSASTLQGIYFSSALFSRIPDAFRHLKSLTTFSLQDTDITDWNDEAMKNIGQTLVTLYLDNVGFKSWPSWLHYFSRLSQLAITKCSFSLIPDDALDNSASTLTILTMNNNKLTQVPKAFSKLTSLKELYLQNNYIVDVSWLPPSTSLATLYLNGNFITNATVLSNMIRQYAKSLSAFDISSNRLTSVPNITFLTLIDNLDFSENMISDPYSGAVAPEVNFIDFTNNFLPAIPRVLTTLQSVTLLSVSYNSIKQIQGSDFPITATMIQLGSNLITELTENCFPVNSRFDNLDLNTNPIVTISSGAFSNLGKLRELDLSGARLTRLPLALTSLSGLHNLGMYNIPNLVCTCMEKSIGTWILSKSYFEVSGSCGLLDIKQLFTTLSPLCP